MSNRKQRLELTWIGKDERPRLEPRILLEDAEKSYHAKARVTDHDIFDNVLIHGDNLLALKALEQEYTGKVKCVYIDPPFNTGQALPNYDDGVEHSIWLTLMRDRLEIIHKLLSTDGTLFVHIDDNEIGYLIALLDSIFGRNNRLYIVTFKQGSATGHKSINPGCVTTTNFIVIYARDKSAWTPNRVYTGRERDTRYGQFITNPDDSYEEWRFTTLTKAYAIAQGVTEKDARKSVKEFPEKLDEFVLQNARQVIRLARPDYDSVSEAAREMIDKSKDTPSRLFRLPREDHSDMYFKGGERILFYADKLKLVDGEYVAGEPLTTLWDDILSNNLHNEGGVEFPKGKKPEALIKRVLDLATKEGDLVLDSFAGSGTTGAVAHKMGRRWIMVELGEHACTHVIPRLTSVLNGTDTSGITKAVNWKGGGGFRYYRIAPSLLEKDPWGNWVISKEFDAAKLSQAVCKLMGFVYQPDETHYWMQGRSSETDFIYVTTQSLTHDQLSAISEAVGDERTLLVCCKAFRANADAFPNLTIRKIPQAVLRKCEWGHDDYSLNVANLPETPREAQGADDPAQPPKTRKKRNGNGTSQDDLFSQEGGK
ncbi:TPA: site-specific DNA-methyltransferase [Burkholderia cenocepacia]|uniref:site-specific DNA-methyltransferase n=1 Tax=Burkholderia cenocepacia TaxID=95486 RepID=UPI001B94B12B|nr:site-specific DNA-methyltransferase [Burkholderia cenocepacia]MBR8098240.1 site-specific DNA-methyltransferase [Burkholderia cenocepacia]HEP6426258.1 site-specific DNA-methyltransferase [Burkholderia cenocepacia]